MIFEYFALLAAGLLTFASPCILPLVPTYLALLAGAGTAGDEDVPSRTRRLRRAAIGFTLGLGTVFVALGFAASALAAPLAAQRGWIGLGAGALMLVLGLQLLGWPRLAFLNAESRPLLARLPRVRGFGGGLFFGAAFALGWTPCVGPVLGAALTRAATHDASWLQSGLGLGIFAAGLALPLLAAAYASEHVLPFLTRLRAKTRWVQRGMGVAVAAFALSLAYAGVRQLRAAATTSCTGPQASTCSTGAGTEAEPHTVLRGRARLVEFVSGSCPVCQRMAPGVRDLERDCAADPGALLRVRVDEPHGRALAASYGVRLVPTFVSVDASGAEVFRLVGEQSRSELEVALRDVTGACQL